MLEVIKNPLNDSYSISVDGTIIDDAYAYEHGKEKFEYVSKSKNASKKLISQKLLDFAPYEYISLENVFDWINFRHSIFIMDDYEFRDDVGKEPYYTGKLKLTFSFNPDYFEWNKSFGFGYYATVFETLFHEYEKLNGQFYFYNEERPSFDLSIIITKSDLPIKFFLLPYSEDLWKLHKEILQVLPAMDDGDSLVSSFKFPAELKTHCEQYLLYFAQFLQDLGINVTSNLKEEAGKVLFSVTPSNDAEALDKIQKALAIYLKLPESPIIFDDSFKSMRTQQQIENLQHSQRMAEREIRASERELRLAQTVIEYQDKIIVQKDVTIEQQNRIIEKITSKSIMMDSLENKAEFEKIFEGLEFGESKELKEKLGIKFNPVTSLKSLGRKLSGGDDEITSLNLNDETDKKD